VNKYWKLKHSFVVFEVVEIWGDNISLRQMDCLPISIIKTKLMNTYYTPISNKEAIKMKLKQ